MGQNRNQLIAVLADERLKQEDKIMANNAMLSSDGKRKAIFEMGSNKPAVHERV
jgi:hypothetical protein